MQGSKIGAGVKLKLVSLKINAKGLSGLETEVLGFGVNITQLFGATGTGKTPIVKSIAYCLGCDIEFRQEIYERCDSAVLTLEINGKKCVFSRKYLKGREFEVLVTYQNSPSEYFYSEESFSSFLFGELELAPRALISKGGERISPYISTVLPLFYVTQDEGYSSVYKPTSSFINDQFSEMVRFSFGLPEKNSFDKKKKQHESKRKLDSLDQLVVQKRQNIEVIKSTVDGELKSVDELEEKISLLEGELSQLENGQASRSDSFSALDSLIDSKKTDRRNVLSELNLIRNKRGGLESIKEEIETEINTLSLNEDARRIFSSFKEICSNGDCGLFSHSSESYARNLLYLKDQIKDLEVNDQNNLLLETKLDSELGILDSVISDLEKERATILDSSDMSGQLKAISELKIEIFKTHSLLVDSKKIEHAEKDFVNASNRREEALNEHESYRTGGKIDLRVTEFKSDLRDKFVDWLGSLNTSNISLDVSFRSDFEPVLGEELVKQLSGSTSSRTVLAFHGALFEIAVERSPIKLLILDAPKQHETENVDLDRYMKKIKSICHKNGVQAVFSATEYKYVGDKKDKVWEPGYEFGDKKMFMRLPLSSSQS